MNISAIILAAGMSCRMGHFKLFLDYKDKKVINAIVETVLSSNVSDVIIVSGHKHKLLEEELEKYSIKPVFNKDYKEGMHTSVMCGIRNINKNADAFMIILGDQPQISISIINRVINRWQKTDKGIVVPSFSNKRGHPVIFDRKYLHQAINLEPDTGLKKVINNNKDDIEYLIVDNDDVLFDIDTPEDYKLLLKR